MKILVLSCFSRNALAVISALDPSYEIYGADTNTDNFVSRTFKTSRIKKIFCYAHPLDNPEKFREDLLTISRNTDIDAVIPTGTDPTNGLSRIKQDIEQNSSVRCLVEDYSKLKIFTDKWQSYNLCKKVGIPVPKTILVNNFQEIESALHNGVLSYPFIIKPTITYASIGFSSFAAHNQYLSFKKEKSGIFSKYGSFVMQEAIDGELHDVTSCSRDGRVLSMLSQKRVQTWEDFGGGGIINKTTFEPEIMGYAEKMLGYIKWNGPVLWDFIQDKKNKKYFLLEINPKFWGTTQLTISAGLNMPQQLVDFWLFDKTSSRVSEYEKDLLFKWIFPYCIIYWFKKPRSIENFLRRFRKTLSNDNAKRVITNFKVKDVRHFIGTIFKGMF